MLCSIGNIPELKGWYAVLGFVILFAAVIGITFVVKAIAAKLKKNEEKPISIKEESTKEIVDDKAAEGRSGEMLLVDVKPREAAMVMAIVADEMETPLNELQFISIKKVKEEKQQ